MGKQLTEHFHSREFDCNDGTPVPERYYDQLTKLCRWYLEPLRERFGPCTVHSGFRTPSWNVRIGGARLSFHVYTIRKPRDGVAADISFARGSVNDWYQVAKAIRQNKREGQGGLGYYPQGGFIHVDTRDYSADWNGS